MIRWVFFSLLVAFLEKHRSIHPPTSQLCTVFNIYNEFQIGITLRIHWVMVEKLGFYHFWWVFWPQRWMGYISPNPELFTWGSEEYNYLQIGMLWATFRSKFKSQCSKNGHFWGVFTDFLDFSKWWYGP